ncbi:O-acyltransferase like protein-like [Lingula anatina]|uniref:O-acyltransferase like protein-like n=1 Tax=Lingula anatina TaxID=7574 RepID=A0A1S3IRN2_LINAN|nr:O-acyltransferase like protein-like [Lingula anatina]|eukprot:XP_013400867.1 O-acyltransferase like protein-like [Lingula anatina]
MQFYVISPLFLLPLFWIPALGVILCVLLLVASIIATGLISYGVRSTSDVPSLSFMNLDMFTSVYVAPWCRVGPYLVGVLLGYALNRTQCTLKLPTAAVLFGWITSLGLCTSVIYVYHGNVHEGGGDSLWSDIGGAAYDAISRPAFAMGVAWIILACVTGHGGVVNSLLSHPAWTPLSRLVYSVFLIHLPVMVWFGMSQRTMLYMTDSMMAYIFIGHVVVSFGAAFLVSLTIEVPLVAVETVLLGKKQWRRK